MSARGCHPGRAMMVTRHDWSIFNTGKPSLAGHGPARMTPARLLAGVIFVLWAPLPAAAQMHISPHHAAGPSPPALTPAGFLPPGTGVAQPRRAAAGSGMPDRNHRAFDDPRPPGGDTTRSRGPHPATGTRHEPASPPTATTAGAPQRRVSDAPFDEASLRARIPAAVNLTDDWHLHKTHWSPEDEGGYEAFIRLVGGSSCDSLDACLRDSANPYRDLDDGTIFLGDCADMVYFLRGYYAWKNGLPFSYQHRMVTASGAPEDLRYSSQGNIAVGRRSVINTTAHTVSAKQFLGRIRNEISTAMFRTHPITGTRNTFDDFYPVRIDRAAIRPGSIAYDVFGHVGLTYGILDDGNIPIVASHPDFRVTRSRYGSNFIRTGPEFGGGLKAWRPTRLVGAHRTHEGHYIGGRIEGTANESIADFSMEQYEGTVPNPTVPNPTGNWQAGGRQAGEFQYKGRTLEFYDFVRKRLAAPGYGFDPLVEMRAALEHICAGLLDRRVAIGLATRAKFYLKPHPDTLPPNIYGTYGEWELYSTPSRDARLKKSFVDLMGFTVDQITRHRDGADDIAYEGDNLARDMLDVYQGFKNDCKIRYRRSDDSFVILNFAHLNQRVFEMSFDPYHCPELRWGASGNERSTCIATPDKYAWYEAQRYMRYQVERTYDTRMDFTLTELRPPDKAGVTEGGLGVLAPPDIDIGGFLRREVRHATQAASSAGAVGPAPAPGTVRPENTGPENTGPENTPGNN